MVYRGFHIQYTYKIQLIRPSGFPMIRNILGLFFLYSPQRRQNINFHEILRFNLFGNKVSQTKIYYRLSNNLLRTIN